MYWFPNSSRVTDAEIDKILAKYLKLAIGKGAEDRKMITHAMEILGGWMAVGADIGYPVQILAAAAVYISFSDSMKSLYPGAHKRDEPPYSNMSELLETLTKEVRLSIPRFARFKNPYLVHEAEMRIRMKILYFDYRSNGPTGHEVFALLRSTLKK